MSAVPPTVHVPVNPDAPPGYVEVPPVNDNYGQANRTVSPVPPARVLNRGVPVDPTQFGFPPAAPYGYPPAPAAVPGYAPAPAAMPNMARPVAQPAPIHPSLQEHGQYGGDVEQLYNPAAYVPATPRASPPFHPGAAPPPQRVRSPELPANAAGLIPAAMLGIPFITGAQPIQPSAVIRLLTGAAGQIPLYYHAVTVSNNVLAAFSDVRVPMAGAYVPPVARAEADSIDLVWGDNVFKVVPLAEPIVIGIIRVAVFMILNITPLTAAGPVQPLGATEAGGVDAELF